MIYSQLNQIRVRIPSVVVFRKKVLRLMILCNGRRFIFLFFQLSETDDQDLPPFPAPKDLSNQTTVQPTGSGADTGPILPVPVGIRPTLAKYR